MGYKWKPNAAQKAEYRAKMQEKEKLNIINTPFAIRKGCIVEFYSTNKGEIIKGTVTNHSYGKKTNQHTFTIDYDLKVKGRNLYPNLLQHIQGEESKKTK